MGSRDLLFFRRWPPAITRSCTELTCLDFVAFFGFFSFLTYLEFNWLLIGCFQYEFQLIKILLIPLGMRNVTHSQIPGPD